MKKVRTGRTILWADDDTDDLMLMNDIVSETNHDYEIIEVHNGKEALEYLRKCDKYPCLIILDINMPVLNGQETLAIIKMHELYKSIPIVVFTTSNSELDREFCKKYNVDMITKPPEYTKFQNIILKLLSYCN